MAHLTDIEAKQNRGDPLTQKEIRFLYEFDEPILGLGYNKDPRIEPLKLKREVKEDLSFVLGISQKKISTTQEEALSGSIVYHFGSLDLSGFKSAEGLILPQTVGGYLNLSGLQSAEGLTLPQTVGGYLNLSSLQSAEGLTLPQTVSGGLNLSGLQSAEGLSLPQTVGGFLDLSGLQSADGLTLLQTLGGDLYLGEVKSAVGLTLPQKVGRIYFVD